MKKIVPTLNYEALLLSLPTAVIVFGADDPNFTILAENQAHAQIADVSRKDIIGRPLLEAFPDTSERFLKNGESELLESIRRVIKTRKVDVMPNLHYDIKDRDGTLRPRYWSVAHYPVLQSGSVAAVYQITNDITEKTVASNELETTRYQLEQILKARSIGTWVWKVDDKCISGDENTAGLFGLDPQMVKAGLPIEAYVAAIHPDDRTRVTDEFAKASTKHELYEVEYRTIDGSGDVHWVVARGYFENSGEGERNQSPGIVVDVTERKRAEENLTFLTNATAQFSASLGYEKILQSITSMVVPRIADWCAIELLKDGTLQQVALAHVDPKKVKWAKELRRTQGAPSLDEPNGVAKVIRTGETEYYPEISREFIEASAKNDEERDLMLELGFSSVVIVPMTLDGKTIGALTLVATESRLHFKPADVEVAKTLANRAALAVYNATLYDEAQHELADRRALQRDLQLLNDELEYRVEERTKELQVMNRGLEREIRKRHRAEKALDLYSKELARSNQELQDFAYVASHDLQEPLRKIQAFGDLLEGEFGVELGENGEQYLSRMRNAASRMSVLIEDLLSFSRVTTKAQPNRAVNLNDIAKEVVSDLDARVTSAEGTVDIQPLPTVWANSTHMRQLFQNLIGNALKFHRPNVPPHVKVYAKPLAPKDTMHTIYFEDNGIGFDEKYLDRIFAVFQRLHGKDEYEGTGIGLAVCRKIAERYGGTITAASTEGSGSKFSLSIPITGRKSSNE